MTSFPQYQQQFAATLKTVISPPLMASSASLLTPMLEALIDAWPYYGDYDWEICHRSALSNLLATNLPNNQIAPQPDVNGFTYFSSYSYTGGFSGYRDAFFRGITQTSTASRVLNRVQAVNSNLNSGWWGNYAIAVLSDTIRQRVAIPINTSKLTSDLGSYHGAFLPALAASYLAVFETGYSPTTNALNAIISAGQSQEAANTLGKAIQAGQFTANINQIIGLGGDSTNAATWFLFNLWITLQALGANNVDSIIEQARSAGLIIPSQVGPSNWWNGGYSSWYIALSGADLTSNTVTADLPEQEFTTYSGATGGGSPTNTKVPNGYAQSFCNWGSLNVYNPPPPSSCFGKGTGVLMADGSVQSIELVKIGDEVQSTVGVRKVILVETPKRGQRTLYQINNLNVWATSAHPFRSVAPEGPKRLAVDDWALLEGFPTMIEDGIGHLQSHCQLAGWRKNGTESVTVEQITSEDLDSEDELVYDLLLEKGSKEDASYLVGGPDNFVAVDSESADVMYDLLGAIAILTALNIALPISRQYLTNPNIELPAILARLQLNDLRGLAHQSLATLANTRLPAVPVPADYMQDGVWDDHASALDFHLVKQFSPLVRREAAMGWRVPVTPLSQDAHFTICIHDIVLIGNFPIPANKSLEIHLNLRGKMVDISQRITLAPNPQKSWAAIADQVVDFGQLDATFQSGVLTGTLKIEAETLGVFRFSIDNNITGLRIEHFIFNAENQIIGKIAVEHRLINPQDLATEQQQLKQWTKRQASSLAISIGTQLGHKIVDEIHK